MSLRSSTLATAAMTAAMIGCTLLAPSVASAAPTQEAATGTAGQLQMWDGSQHYSSGQFVITNPTAGASDWELTFSVPNGSFENHSDWNVDAKVDGDRVTLTPKNGALAAGMSEYVSFGIAGDGSSALTVQGCDLGGAAVGGCSAAEDQGQAPTTPGDVHVTDVAHDRVTVNWTPSTDDGPGILYTVTLLRDGDVIREYPVPGAHRTSQVVDRLDPDRDYEVVVTARDSDDNVSAAEAVSFTTAADPSVAGPATPADVHVNTEQSDRVIVNWNSPVTPELLGHQVLLFQDGELIRAHVIANPRQASVIVDRLTAGTDYEVAVLAYDRSGHETTSDRVAFSTAR